ncbi:MAG: DsbA family oxidoreductase [Ilumatobacteraceae bacterium]
MASVIRVEIWSDVVCPWCYIGKRRFERAIESLTTGPDAVDADFEIAYRAYQLDPTAPKDGSTPVREAYATKFAGAERADAIIANLTETAAADGLEFRMDIALRSNTILAHRLLWFAETRFGSDAQHQLKERFLRAYFMEGRNVGQVDTLIEVTTDVLPATDSELRDFIASEEGIGEVAEQMATAVSHGITGVPTYVINGQWAIPGAQDSETFERVLRRAVERSAG